MMEVIIGSCQSVSDALSDVIEKRVGFVSRVRFKLHLGMCPMCKVYFGQFKRIYKECGRVEPTQLPADFDDVMAKVIRDWKGER